MFLKVLDKKQNDLTLLDNLTAKKLPTKVKSANNPLLNSRYPQTNIIRFKGIDFGLCYLFDMFNVCVFIDCHRAAIFVSLCTLYVTIPP